jgi:hypothetical protein
VGSELPPANLCREPRSDLPAGFAFNAIWQQLDDLLVLKQPMVTLPRIETDAAGAPLPDANGNARGGWRLPQMEVPLARYAGRSSPQDAGASSAGVCAQTGAMQRFEPAQLKALYRDRNEFLRRFNAAVDVALQARLLVKEDAESLKAAARTAPAF